MQKQNEEKIEYYDLQPIDSKNCKYSVIFGKRSNGKTFALLKKIIYNYAMTGQQGAYIRRFEEDMIGKRGSGLCDGVVKEGIVKAATKGKWDSVYYYSHRWYFARKSDIDGKLLHDEIPFMIGFSLNSMEHDKGSTYPKVTIVVFDEFISRTYYLTDEFVLFMNVLSTIIRLRTNVRIYMLGNTVNKYCPYFKEMGLKHISQMNPHDIDLYTYNDPNLTVAVEYSDLGKNSDKPKANSYFAFDNPKLQMITGGLWELEIYPHLPRKYLPKNVIFSYFIIFEEHILHAEIVQLTDCVFTYIHEKTTPIQNENKDIIFSQQYDPRPNWFRNLRRPIGKIDKKIAAFFREDNVYYQDNEVGEVVRNYLLWCAKSSSIVN